jgi:hypothetical protein
MQRLLYQGSPAMNTSQHVRDALASAKITFSEMNISPAASIQNMSHRELEAELSFHIGHAKSTHIAATMGRYNRSEKPDTRSATPSDQAGYRSKPLQDRQKSWGS